MFGGTLMGHCHNDIKGAHTNMAVKKIWQTAI